MGHSVSELDAIPIRILCNLDECEAGLDITTILEHELQQQILEELLQDMPAADPVVINQAEVIEDAEAQEETSIDL